MKTKTKKKPKDEPAKNIDILSEKDGAILYKGLKEGGHTMFFRQDVGEAKHGKTVYELTVNVGNFAPMITNKTTGRIVAFSWQGLIDKAREMGIDETTKAEGKS